MRHTIFPNTEKIDFSKKLRVKFGIDPTSDKLHLGHLIPLLFVKKLWEEGHYIDIVLGTFTAQLGDPSGKDTMRPILTKEETEANANNIIEQVIRIFALQPNSKNIRIHRNGEWFSCMDAVMLTNLLSKFTLTQLLSRDSFQKRFLEGNSIGMHELVVPILQGYDSFTLQTQVEIGGSDQLFNFVISRDVQRSKGQEPEKCILMPIINGTDGRKMSKSFDNCIFINDTPKDVFGKTMSISDELMKEWWPILSDSEFPKEEHPMELKKDLAWLVTKEIWGEDAARHEFEQFEMVIQNKSLPESLSEIELPKANSGKAELDVLETVVKIKNCSKNEARRLIEGGGVRLLDKDGSVIDVCIVNTIRVEVGTILKFGKRNFVKLV
jgi:tyrosyl-tRNA synthetase